MVITKENSVKKYDIQTLYNRDFKSHQYLMPIPRTEIEKSMNTLTQNDGYATK